MVVGMKIAVGILIAVLIFSGLYFYGGFDFSYTIWDGCTWQPDYCFASCVVDVAGSTRQIIQSSSTFQCPETADVHECEIQSPVTCPQPCTAKPGIYDECVWWGLSWNCYGPVQEAYEGAIIERGQWFWNNPSLSSVTVGIIRKTIQRCGTAACVGGGVPVVGAQGCSWNPGDSGYVWEDGSIGAKSIPFGTGYPYVCSQHLVSCPSTCSDPMVCSVPQNLRNFVMNYNGERHKAYVTCIGSQCTVNVVGCKTEVYNNVCIEKDYATNQCLEYGEVEYGECGTIDSLPGGQCSMDSDCGAVGVYYCDWDEETLTGVCKEFQEHECDYDWDCDQIGTGCFDREINTVRCVNNLCKKETKAVDCCSSADCAPGYFCNVKYECQKSQGELPDCPFACCDQTYNALDAQYKQKSCPTAEPVCCGDNTCAITVEACTAPPSNEAGGWNWIWIVVLGVMGALIGYVAGGYIGAVAGAIIGGIAGYAVYWFMSLAWWQQLLLGIGGGILGAVAIYLLIIGIPALILLIAVLRGK